MNEGKRKQASDRLLFARAKDLMESHQVFLEPDLTLNKMADRLERSRTSLSSVINRETGKNFSVWLAEYRINYFVENYLKGKDRICTLWLCLPILFLPLVPKLLQLLSP